MVDDSQSGLWIVAFNEWADLLAGFLLQKVYESYRLWAISPVFVGLIRKIDLSVPLGC